jgi:hypothetical protein
MHTHMHRHLHTYIHMHTHAHARPRAACEANSRSEVREPVECLVVRMPCGVPREALVRMHALCLRARPHRRWTHTVVAVVRRYVSVKAISLASHETALALVHAAPMPATLSTLLALATDTHHQTRRGVAEYIGALLTAMSGGAGGDAGGGASERQAVGVLGALKALTADADPKVREAAAKCFWIVHGVWPEPAELLRGKLDPSQMKLLKRLQPGAAPAAAARARPFARTKA